MGFPKKYLIIIYKNTNKKVITNSKDLSVKNYNFK